MELLQLCTKPPLWFIEMLGFVKYFFQNFRRIVGSISESSFVWNVEKERKAILFSSWLNNWSKMDNKHSKMGWDLTPWLVLRYIFPGRNSPPLMLNTAIQSGAVIMRYNITWYCIYIWTNDNLCCRCIFSLLGLNELRPNELQCCQRIMITVCALAYNGKHH